MKDVEKGSFYVVSEVEDQLLPASARSVESCLTPSLRMPDEHFLYRLWPEERFLLGKYCQTSGRVLDLACGMGRTALCIHEMGLPVVGIDSSEALIRAIRRRFPYLDLQVGSLTDTGQPDVSFTSVFISSQTIDLLYPETLRIAALHECARILEPGGMLIYSSRNVKSLHLFSPRHWRNPVWKLRRTFNAFKRFAVLSQGGIEGVFAAPEAVIAQTEQAGFRFLEMRGSKMSPSPFFNRLFSLYIYYVFRKI